MIKDNASDSPKKPRRTKAEMAGERRKKVESWVGITFEGELGQQLAEAIDDAVRTGARRLDPDDDANSYAIECSPEYHFARFKGTGASLVPSIYHIVWRITGERNGETGTVPEARPWTLSARELARYLDAEPEYVYRALDLLVRSGFFEVIETELGKPTKYRPVGHKKWAEGHPGMCVTRWKFPYQDDDELATLGKNLHAILGGEKFFRNVLIGYQRSGLSDAEICRAAKAFFEEDRGKGSGKERRKRFGEYLKTWKPA